MKKTIGYAEIAGFAGVDDNGKAVIEAPIVSVNVPVTAPNLKHQSRIAGRRFTLTEEEDTSAKIQGNRMVAYRKEIVGRQEPLEGKRRTYESEPEEDEEKEPNWLIRNVKEISEKAWGRSSLALGLSISALLISAIMLMSILS
jgi:hypothetical protein